MNSLFINLTQGSVRLVILVFALILAACATTDSPSGAEQARNKLEALQSDPGLVEHAPVEFREAEEAVRLAENSGGEEDLVAHRVYMAQRKVDIAEAAATAR